MAGCSLDGKTRSFSLSAVPTAQEDMRAQFEDLAAPPAKGPEGRPGNQKGFASIFIAANPLDTGGEGGTVPNPPISRGETPNVVADRKLTV
jgi:hypothetical protein